MMSRRQTAALGIALASCALVFVWQALTVHYNYGGNWTGLFYSGTRSIPPELASENIFQLRSDPGYDGQFYHYVAHDPLFDRNFDGYVDNPRLRWRRILIPGLAYLVAFGQDEAIDAAYFAVTLVFVFLGAWWLGLYCSDHGLHPACGLAFPLIPAVLVSIDRMTIDTALAALTVGLALYAGRGAFWQVCTILALAPLARETGLSLIAGLGLWTLLRKEWKRAACVALTPIPWLAWAAFVQTNTAPDQTVFLSIPFRGILTRTLHPVRYSLATSWLRTAAVTDYVALLGIWLALAIVVVLVWRARLTDPVIAVAACFAAGVPWLGQPSIWNGAYEFARPLSPLLILVALSGITRRIYWCLLPLAMSLPRFALQFQPQAKSILHGVIKG